MPQLSPSTEALRSAQVIDVMGLILDGATVIDACDQVGITPRQYRYWIQLNPDFVKNIRSIIEQSERLQLAAISSARSQLIEQIITDALTSRSLADKITADKHLQSIQRELEDRHGAHGMERSEASEFLLDGPQLRKSKSRHKLNIMPKHDGSVDITLDAPSRVIDLSEYENEID